jgi:hypothetical protein
MALVSKAEAKRLAVRDNRIAEMRETVAELDSREAFAQEIRGLWEDARKRFLDIGKYLIQAKKKLAHGEYMAMIHDDLPFNVSIAFQLRAVAEAVEDKRMTVEELPLTYSAAYHLATLNDDELTEARQRNLVRPNVRRSDVVDFKKALRDGGRATNEAAGLKAEEQRLLQRLAKIREKIAMLESTQGGRIIDTDYTTIEQNHMEDVEDAVAG